MPRGLVGSAKIGNMSNDVSVPNIATRHVSDTKPNDSAMTGIET